MGHMKIGGATLREDIARAIWKRWLQMAINSALSETKTTVRKYFNSWLATIAASI
jgi:hypothetical protein